MGGSPNRAAAPAEPILVEGRTCWRRARAGRVAFLVDGASYFAALADAIGRAERQVLLIGWDFHSRVRLRRLGGEGEESELAALLDARARARRRLQVHVLGWDFAMIYALEREALPLFRFGLRTHRRVRFRLDGEHPVGASHHQKLAVIDDGVAFAGGIDVTAARWDTREHRASDPRRRDIGHGDYGPFHDAQMAVDGEAARALGELARTRWQRATGQRLPRPRSSGDPWPERVVPDLRDVAVGIARTEPAFEDRPDVREVEALHVAAIAAARRSIYIENQYLTAAQVGDALAERLAEPEGPEVVVVGPSTCEGWLEQTTMGVLRARLVRRLRDADRHDRLRLYHPTVPGLGDARFMVHAKLTVVDERLARIGSANLSNRSMGLDTECDLAIEADGDERVSRAIGSLRDGLLAEHLGVERERVAEAHRREGSLVRAIESLRGGDRTLVPLDTDVPGWLDDVVPDGAVVDPEQPVSLDELADMLVPEELPEPRSGPVLRTALVLLIVAALAAVWRWTPLAGWVEPARLSALASWLREGWAGPLLAVVAIGTTTCLMVPITALIVAAALVFGWALGFAVGLAGSLLGAALGYALGRLLWRDAVRRLAGSRLDRVSHALGERGVVSMALVRLVPVAPFTVVNLVAGASHIGLRDYLLGTLLAMAPGSLALAVFAQSALDAARAPGPGTVVVAVVAAVALALVVRIVRGRLREAARRESESDDS